MGYEKILFSKGQYKKILKSKNFRDNYLQFQDIIDKEIYDFHINNQLPLIIRENFYIKENPSKNI